MSPKRPGPLPTISAPARIAILVGGTLVFLGCTALLTLIVTGAIWPGEARLVASSLCTDAHPDAFVVSDSYATSDGQSVDFTLYCVSPDGDAIDAGWARPWFLCWALHTAILMVVGGAFQIRQFLRHRRKLAAALGSKGDGDSDDEPKRSDGPRDDDRRPIHEIGTADSPQTLVELLERDFPTDN